MFKIILNLISIILKIWLGGWLAFLIYMLTQAISFFISFILLMSNTVVLHKNFSNFEFVLAIIISTILIKIFRKNISKVTLTALLFFFVCLIFVTYYHFGWGEKSIKEIISIIQSSYLQFILIPLLPLFIYFLPGIILKIKNFIKHLEKDKE